MRKVCLIVCVLFGCSTNKIVQQMDYFQSHRVTSIPINAVAKMDSFIVSKAGRDLFYNCFVFDTSESGFFRGDTSFQKPNIDENSRYMAHPYNLFVYYFHLPKKPWHKQKLWWPVDTSGDFIQNNLPYGIPDCQSVLSNCSFSIDSLEAINIAKKAGIPLGIDTLRAGFGFAKRKYEWCVSSTISKGKHGAESIYYSVDINSGEIIEQICLQVDE